MKGQDTPAVDAADDSLIKLIFETLNQHAKALHIITQRVLALDEQLKEVRRKASTTDSGGNGRSNVGILTATRPKQTPVAVSAILRPEQGTALAESKHQLGIAAFEQGRYEEAARLFTQALEVKETAERWNDWATAQMMCQRGLAAEKGYRHALELDTGHHQAAANLGILLTGVGRFVEATPLLEQAINAIDPQQRAVVEQLLARCRETLAAGNGKGTNGVRLASREEPSSTENTPSAGQPNVAQGLPSNRKEIATPAVRVEVKQPRSREEVITAVNAIPRWWHTIELPFGVTTPGRLDHRPNVAAWGLPSDLGGKTVLDVGCLDGFWSFEAEKRGAKHVLAVDSWVSDLHCNERGFLTAHALLGSKVESEWVDLFDLTPEKYGRFDLILCLGVLYHLRHPLLGLERLAQLCRGQLILETAIDPRAQGCSMKFDEGDELNQDPTNWWEPSLECVVAMLRSCGFGGVRPVHVNGARAVFHAFAPGLSGGIRQMLARFGEELVAEAYQKVVGSTPGSSLEKSLAVLPIDLFGKLKQAVLEQEVQYRIETSSPDIGWADWCHFP